MPRRGPHPTSSYKVRFGGVAAKLPGASACDDSGRSVHAHAHATDGRSSEAPVQRASRQAKKRPAHRAGLLRNFWGAMAFSQCIDFRRGSAVSNPAGFGERRGGQRDHCRCRNSQGEQLGVQLVSHLVLHRSKWSDLTTGRRRGAGSSLAFRFAPQDDCEVIRLRFATSYPRE